MGNALKIRTVMLFPRKYYVKITDNSCMIMTLRKKPNTGTKYAQGIAKTMPWAESSFLVFVFVCLFVCVFVCLFASWFVFCLFCLEFLFLFCFILFIFILFCICFCFDLFCFVFLFLSSFIVKLSPQFTQQNPYCISPLQSTVTTTVTI